MRQEVWGVKVTEHFEDGPDECLQGTFYLRYNDAKAVAKEEGGRVVRLTDEELGDPRTAPQD